MERECSLPRSQQLASGHHPEPNASSPQFLQSRLPKVQSNIVFPSTPRS